MRTIISWPSANVNARELPVNSIVNYFYYMDYKQYQDMVSIAAGEDSWPSANVNAREFMRIFFYYMLTMIFALKKELSINI